MYNKGDTVMPKDPVCLMDVNENVELKKKHGEKMYYFCSEFCLKKFSENADRYLVRHKEYMDE